MAPAQVLQENLQRGPTQQQDALQHRLGLGLTQLCQQLTAQASAGEGGEDTAAEGIRKVLTFLLFLPAQAPSLLCAPTEQAGEKWPVDLGWDLADTVWLALPAVLPNRMCREVCLGSTSSADVDSVGLCGA